MKKKKKIIMNQLVEEYLNKIRLYLKGIINNKKNLTCGKFN